jgi:hypothetical protein
MSSKVFFILHCDEISKTLPLTSQPRIDGNEDLNLRFLIMEEVSEVGIVNRPKYFDFKCQVKFSNLGAN